MKELIELAKEIGFESILTNTVSFQIISLPKEFYYLYLCELQEWMEESKGVIINPVFNFAKLNYDVFIYIKENDFGKHIIEDCKDRKEALDYGLKYGLEEIK